MPRPPRVQFKGAFYHVYNRGVDKQPICRDEIDCYKFIEVLGDAVKEYGLELYAYCLLRNHYHLFLQTPLGNLKEAMWHFGSRYVSYLNFRYDRVGPLFQGRYKSRLVDTDEYSLTLVRYIHQNPMEAGIVGSLDEYRWSSYRHYSEKLSKPAWLDTRWILNQFGNNLQTARAKFIEYHEGKIAAEKREEIEKFGSVLGTTEFRRDIKRGLAPFKAPFKD
jgi:putative transposase